MLRCLGLLLLILGACSAPPPDEAVRVAFVGAPEELAETGLRLSEPAQAVRAATAQGLVRLDESGEVVPGIAQSWIVTDDGLSYIFRLRDLAWPDGEPVTAQQVAAELRRTLRDLRGTTLGLDLAKVTEVRAMAGRVVEVELASPMAQFLRLLAQPELGVLRDGAGLGPMRWAEGEREAGGTLELAALSPSARGLPEDENWQEGVRPVRIAALPAAQAIAAFADGRLDAVLGGGLMSLPLVDTGPLARGAVRVDAAIGTFGFDVTAGEGFLAEPANREAVALAIDRDTLLEPFNLEGWTPATRIVPPALPGNPRQNAERWTDLDLAARQEVARRRAGAWRVITGAPPLLRIALPNGPGSDLLFRQVAEDLGAVGIAAERAGADDLADLTLRDRVARYGQARWFLNQFHCSVERSLCSAEADELVERATAEPDPATRAALLVQAEDALTGENLFIPLGAPVRWSLLRGDAAGFGENPWAVHPLFALSGAPI